MRARLGFLLLFFLPGHHLWAASGTEGASFLDIPVGGAPAAMGSAYSAQANNAYASVWNPAGLGFLPGVEFTGMHLSYLGPLHYEHAGFAVPFGKEAHEESGTSGIGGSVQYLGTGNIDSRDENGNSVGTFTSDFAAYTLSYGLRVAGPLSLGASAKIITEHISDASASAFGGDFGLLYKPSSTLRLGAVLANVGSELKFVNEADPLPLAARFGVTNQLFPQWDVSGEVVTRKTGLTSGSLGTEWRASDIISLRAGYNTAHIKELGGASGFTAGLGLFFWGQEFSYAWVPVGDLGQTHYFSLVFRLTPAPPHKDQPELKKPKKKDDESNYDDFFKIFAD